MEKEKEIDQDGRTGLTKKAAAEKKADAAKKAAAEKKADAAKKAAAEKKGAAGVTGEEPAAPAGKKTAALAPVEEPDLDPNPDPDNEISQDEVMAWIKKNQSKAKEFTFIPRNILHLVKEQIIKERG